VTVSPLTSDPAYPTPIQAQAQGVTQTTAVEQTRAAAEVQAAILVAQRCPRDMGRAEAEMLDVCARASVAERAFYSVPDRGTGPSIHLARELARIWGNLDYGVRELRRDVTAGVCEVQAFAWDQQTNVRHTRTFQVPLDRAPKRRGGSRERLSDIDIYRSNQSTGSRAVRECLLSVMPGWFVQTAQDTCRRTIESGDGSPLAERVTRMIDAFAELGVTVAQLEGKTGRARARWDAHDVATLGVVWQTLRRGETRPDEEFPAAPVTVDEVRGREAA
jgi:hypothetical protein